jgi:hypothetical protein
MRGAADLLDDLETLRADLMVAERAVAHAQDPWHWLATAVTTVDELDPQTPVKPFPTHVCVRCGRYYGGLTARMCCGALLDELTYLKDLARQWARAEPPLLLVPKARRMRLSWLFIALHCWLMIQRPASKTFVVSSKEDKSAELVDRAYGILTRLAPGDGGGLELERRQSPPSIRVVDTDATMIGVAEGAHQLRQMTATAIMADEVGTWMNPREAFSALRPTIDGGGRLTLISSAYPGFWAELISGTALG